MQELGPQQKQKPTDGEGDPKCWMKSSLGEFLVQDGFKNRSPNKVTKHKSPILATSVHYHFTSPRRFCPVFVFLEKHGKKVKCMPLQNMKQDEFNTKIIMVPFLSKGLYSYIEDLNKEISTTNSLQTPLSKKTSEEFVMAEPSRATPCSRSHDPKFGSTR